MVPNWRNCSFDFACRNLEKHLSSIYRGFSEPQAFSTIRLSAKGGWGKISDRSYPKGFVSLSLFLVEIYKFVVLVRKTLQTDRNTYISYILHIYNSKHNKKRMTQNKLLILFNAPKNATMLRMNNNKGVIHWKEKNYQPNWQKYISLLKKPKNHQKLEIC